MAATAVANRPSAADVRAWAIEQGITEGFGSRGRISPALAAAFNKGKRGNARYAEKAHVPTLEVTAKPEKGRSVTRRVTVEQVRKAAQAAGVKVGKRGRLSQDVLRAYVLGTLGQ